MIGTLGALWLLAVLVTAGLLLTVVVVQHAVRVSRAQLTRARARSEAARAQGAPAR